MNNKGKGLLAVLGAAAGAFALWKYNKMTPEEKQRLKDKATDTGRRIKEKAGEVEEEVEDAMDN